MQDSPNRLMASDPILDKYRSLGTERAAHTLTDEEWASLAYTWGHENYTRIGSDYSTAEPWKAFHNRLDAEDLAFYWRMGREDGQ